MAQKLALAWRDTTMLWIQTGWDVGNITGLIRGWGYHVLSAGTNASILGDIRGRLRGSKAEVLMYYSGHSTKLPATTTLAAAFAEARYEGPLVTFVMDSCGSAGLVDSLPAAFREAYQEHDMPLAPQVRVYAAAIADSVTRGFGSEFTDALASREPRSLRDLDRQWYSVAKGLEGTQRPRRTDEVLDEDFHARLIGTDPGRQKEFVCRLASVCGVTLSPEGVTFGSPGGGGLFRVTIDERNRPRVLVDRTGLLRVYAARLRMGEEPIRDYLVPCFGGALRAALESHEQQADARHADLTRQLRQQGPMATIQYVLVSERLTPPPGTAIVPAAGHTITALPDGRTWLVTIEELDLRDFRNARQAVRRALKHLQACQQKSRSDLALAANATRRAFGLKPLSSAPRCVSWGRNPSGQDLAVRQGSFVLDHRLSLSSVAGLVQEQQIPPLLA